MLGFTWRWRLWFSCVWILKTLQFQTLRFRGAKIRNLYFGVICFANMGGGGGQNYFQLLFWSPAFGKPPRHPRAFWSPVASCSLCPYLPCCSDCGLLGKGHGLLLVCHCSDHWHMFCFRGVMGSLNSVPLLSMSMRLPFQLVILLLSSMVLFIIISTSCCHYLMTLQLPSQWSAYACLSSSSCSSFASLCASSSLVPFLARSQALPLSLYICLVHLGNACLLLGRFFKGPTTKHDQCA